MSASPVVDGSLTEWGTRLTTLDTESVSVAARPTDSLLYVAVVVRDADLVRTVAQNGLVVWVDPSGGTSRTYGVQYPLGLRRQQAGAAATRSASDPIDAVSLAQLEVRRADTLRTRIPARFDSGLRGQATLNPGSLICELALPVGPAASSEHRLAAQLGQTIAIGLETPDPDEAAEIEAPEPDIGSASGRSEPPSQPGRSSPSRQERRRQAPELPPRPERSTLDRWVTVGTGAP